MEALAKFKLGNGRQISFWLDMWEGDTSFNSQFSKLFRITSLLKGSIAEHWDLELLVLLIFVDY